MMRKSDELLVSSLLKARIDPISASNDTMTGTIA